MGGETERVTSVWRRYLLHRNNPNDDDDDDDDDDEAGPDHQHSIAMKSITLMAPSDGNNAIT